MKIRHMATGKVIEVMKGTNYPKTAYELVEENKSASSSDSGDASEPKTRTASTRKAAKPAAKKTSALKTDDADTSPVTQ